MLTVIFDVTSIGYSTIETKEVARIGYNVFLFPHEYSGEGRGAQPSPEYSCGKGNPLYPIRAASFVSIVLYIRVITKLPNSEQSYKGKVKTHNYINRQNQSTTGKL